jgi:lysozyme family protein
MSKITFEKTKRGYANLFATALIKPKHLAETNDIVDALFANKVRYERVAADVKCPWWFVGIIHRLESSGNFRTHLHNGDPLTAKTVHVPVDRPKTGKPPYTWEYSALDALKSEGIDKVPTWDVPRALYQFEKYNGFGYFSLGVNSPYLWSFTTLYDKGKFTSDGKFSRTAVSKQCGAAAMLKLILERS